jgi:hypothetical protein
MGEWRYSCTILLDLGARLRCDQLHIPAALSPGKEVGLTPEPVWMLWRREKSYTAGNRTQALQPQIPSLYRLSYPDFTLQIPSKYLSPKVPEVNSE